MNKRSMRAFAFGIAVAVGIIGTYYYSFLPKDSDKEITVEDAEALLANKGYIVLTKEKYKKLEEAAKPPQQEVKAPESTPKDKENTIHAYKLEIKAGMVSHEIASILEKEKIIDNADEFEIYLEENGYSKRIQLGKFELTAGMSYKQIAKIITKS